MERCFYGREKIRTLNNEEEECGELKMNKSPITLLGVTVSIPLHKTYYDPSQHICMTEIKYHFLATS